MVLNVKYIKMVGKAISGMKTGTVESKTVSLFEKAAKGVTNVINEGKINFSGIKDMIPTFFRKVGNDNVAGPMLSMQSVENLEKLQKYGIKTIIDFRGEASKEYQQICQQLGFKYFSFPLDLVNNFMNSKVFIKPGQNIRAQVSDDFIKNLKKFFQEVDKGQAYMGCRYGVHRTNTGILLNYLLNPKDYPPPIIKKVDGEQIINLTNQSLNAIKKIIKRLSPEQRKALNIPDDYLSNLYLKKVAKLKEINRLTYGN